MSNPSRDQPRGPVYYRKVEKLVNLATVATLAGGQTFFKGIKYMHSEGLAPEWMSIVKIHRTMYHVQHYLKDNSSSMKCTVASFQKALTTLENYCEWQIKSIEFVCVGFYMNDLVQLKKTLEKMKVEKVVLRNCNWPRKGLESRQLFSVLGLNGQISVLDYTENRLENRFNINVDHVVAPVAHETLTNAILLAAVEEAINNNQNQEIAAPAPQEQRTFPPIYPPNRVKTLEDLACRKVLQSPPDVFLKGVEFMCNAGLAPDRIIVTMRSNSLLIQFFLKKQFHPITFQTPRTFARLIILTFLRKWPIKIIEFVETHFHMEDLKMLKTIINALKVDIVALQNCVYFFREGKEMVMLYLVLRGEKRTKVIDYGNYIFNQMKWQELQPEVLMEAYREVRDMETYNFI